MRTLNHILVNSTAPNHCQWLCKRRSPLTKKLRHRGFTLVELMIALTLALVISGAMVGVLMTNKASYQADEGMSRIQEGGRMAIEMISREIRAAGSGGCARVAPVVFNNLNGGFNWLDFNVPIQGFEANATGPTTTLNPTAPTAVTANGWTPALDTNLVTLQYPPGGTVGAVAGSDVIVLRKVSKGYPLAPPFPPPNPTSAQLNVDPSANGVVERGQIAMVSDCKQTSIFQITGNPTPGAGGGITLAHAASGNPGNACPVWGNGPNCVPGEQTYSSSARLYVGEVLVFFVGLDDANRDAANNPTPTLYRGVLASTGCPGAAGTVACIRADPLVAGVENMQILYGVDDNNDRVPDRMLTAAQVNAEGRWGVVRTVNVGLLIRGDNLVGQTDTEVNTQNFLLTGTDGSTGTVVGTGAFNDRRWRRAFNTTVTIRSRAL